MPRSLAVRSALGETCVLKPKIITRCPSGQVEANSTSESVIGPLEEKRKAVHAVAHGFIG